MTTMLSRRRNALRFLAAAALLGGVATVSFVKLRSVPVAAPEAPPGPLAAPLPASAPPRTWPGIYSVKVSELPPAAELPQGTTRILVLGDSVASFLGLAMRYRQEETHTFVAHRGVGDCAIFEARMHLVDGKQVMGTSCSTTWAADVRELTPDVTLIVQGGAFFGKQACDAAFLEAYQDRILTLAAQMGPAAGRIALAIVPYPIGRWRWGKVLEQVDCFDAMLLRTAEKGRLATVDLRGHVCPTRECNELSDGAPIRPDGLHFDGKGTEETARWTIRELVALTSRTPPFANEESELGGAGTAEP